MVITIYNAVFTNILCKNKVSLYFKLLYAIFNYFEKIPQNGRLIQINNIHFIISQYELK